MFDATLGSPTATSYVSLADADTYFSGSRPAAATAWAAMAGTPQTQQQVLMAATARLDGLGWVGRRLAGPPSPSSPANGQLLAWPRFGVWIDGWQLSTDAIPRGLLMATCELALFYAADLATDPEARTGLEGIAGVKLGGLALTIDDATTINPGALPPIVLRALRGLTTTFDTQRVTR